MNILKKVACICILCMIGITAAQAQKKGFAFGIKGGVNLVAPYHGKCFYHAL
jgi:hypothetical protein